MALGGEEGSPAGGGAAAGGARYAATPPYLRAHSPPHPHYHYPPDHLVYTNIGKIGIQYGYQYILFVFIICSYVFRNKCYKILEMYVINFNANKA